MSARCCGFRPGVSETARNEDVQRCLFHALWLGAREEAASYLGLLPSDLAGGALTFTGARWVREWTYPLQPFERLMGRCYGTLRMEA